MGHRIRVGIPIVAMTLLILISGGCGSDSPLGSGESIITWTMTDGCDDQQGLQVRFFDMDDGTVWPTPTTVWPVVDGETAVFVTDCKKDHLICYGVGTDPETPGSMRWGVHLDRSGQCGDCCHICGGNQRFVEYTLDCP